MRGTGVASIADFTPPITVVSKRVDKFVGRAIGHFRWPML
jgi:hypothetical protein